MQYYNVMVVPTEKLSSLLSPSQLSTSFSYFPRVILLREKIKFCGGFCLTAQQQSFILIQKKRKNGNNF